MGKKVTSVKVYTKHFGTGERKLFIICDTEPGFKTDPGQIFDDVITGIEVQYNNSKTIIKF